MMQEVHETRPSSHDTRDNETKRIGGGFPHVLFFTGRTCTPACHHLRGLLPLIASACLSTISTPQHQHASAPFPVFHVPVSIRAIHLRNLQLLRTIFHAQSSGCNVGFTSVYIISAAFLPVSASNTQTRVSATSRRRIGDITSMPPSVLTPIWNCSLIPKAICVSASSAL